MSHKDALIAFITNTLTRHTDLGLSSHTLLFKERILDSMNILGLIGYVESYLGRRLNDEELLMTNFESVDRIVEVFFHETHN